MDATLENIINNDDLKWIYVGGKGGVGKTTTSCSLAVQMAKSRPNEKILLISTDPAHNTSDTFGQKFSTKPELIQGHSNLFCMEIDANVQTKEMVNTDDAEMKKIEEQTGMSSKTMSKVLNSLPGIDEAMAYAEVMKLLKEMKYDKVIFDTAPTGHTLRLLDFPNTLAKGLGKIVEIKNMMGPMLETVSSMMGAAAGGMDFKKMGDKLDEMMPMIEEIRAEFKDPTKTTFVCVMIAEFLSLYETERLIQKLMELEIDCQNIVVNQLILSDDKEAAQAVLKFRQKLQTKYLQKYDDLYSEDFHMVKLPLMNQEIRGVDKLKPFSDLLQSSTNTMESLAEPIIDNKDLKWIFVGGKGGVGKTTSSCSLAIQLSKTRKNVLLISTDPAHNTSDAFNQKFSKEPVQVTGFDNLFCMEVQPDLGMQGLPDSVLNEMGDDNLFSMMQNFLGDIFNSFPGIDEAMAYYEIWKLVASLDFDCVVFDTAPTGHTLRLLNFPDFLEESLVQISGMKEKMGGMASMMGGMMGSDFNLDSIMGKIDEYLPAVRQIKSEFKNPEKTSFVCVCIAEFLSLYETERLIVELMKLEIDTQAIIINQLFLSEDQTTALFAFRRKLQQKYLDQVDDLYGDDFNICKMPLVGEEIRGSARLLTFSENLLKAYE